MSKLHNSSHLARKKRGCSFYGFAHFSVLGRTCMLRNAYWARASSEYMELEHSFTRIMETGFWRKVRHHIAFLFRNPCVTPCRSPDWKRVSWKLSSYQPIHLHLRGTTCWIGADLLRLGLLHFGTRAQRYFALDVDRHAGSFSHTSSSLRGKRNTES